MARCIKCDRDVKTVNYVCDDCNYIVNHIGPLLNHKVPYIKTIAHLWSYGRKRAPKGKRIIEIRDFIIDIDYPFASTVHKKFPIDFVRKEFQWYLNNDPYDDSITNHATIWKMIQQPGGSFASNYGPLFFANQGGIDDVIRTLRDDPDSRQAIIPMAHKRNIYEGNRDQICTLGIYFSIYQNMLDMTVTMRSNSMVKFGAPIDWVCFTWLWEMIACELGINTGTYTHHAHSAHAYEEDYDLMIDILKQPEYYTIAYPKITDMHDIIDKKFESEFGKWLTEVKL